MSNLISKRLVFLSSALLVLVSCSSSGVVKNPSEASKPADYFKIRSEKEITAKDFVAASQSTHAGRLSAEAFEKSKNLIDAFVVMSFALAVERPQSTGLGGGGFLILRHGQSGQVMAIDFREMAPRRAKPEMYVVDGQLREDLSREGVLAAGVPGFVAGVLQAHMLFGRTPVRELLKPVIQLAREGFEVYEELEYALSMSRDKLANDAQALEIFFKDGKPLRKGDLLVQENLAKTLEAIAKSGRNGFYRGAVGSAIVEQQASAGGLIDQADLNAYQVKMRTPVQTVIGDYQVYSMPPPSSGGTAVIQVLNTLEASDIKNIPADSAEYYHFFASALQKAFADRSKIMGDSDFVPVPYRRLSSKRYAKTFAATIDAAKAKPSRDLDPELWDMINPELAPKKESTETTHFSMLDDRGSMLASTQTVNGFFGAKVMVPGAGFFLNNEMNDFSVAAGVPNLFSAVGGPKANIIQGRKRPLSSMSPTLVLKKWRPFLALGSPAGTRIISCVSSVLSERLFREKDLFTSIAALRTHQQWYPDELRVESPGFSSEVKKSLTSLGHKIVESDLGCRISAVERIEKQNLRAVVDPRGYGTPVGLGKVEHDEPKSL
jgi:gamma-glutamyltranspeptidase / glutathione hydrolase